VAAKPRSEWSPRYRARIEAAERKGLTKAQARGHPGKGERPASEVTGTPLRGAAKRQHAEKQARGVPAVRWSQPSPGGTRIVQTKNLERISRAAAEAASRGQEVLIGAYMREIVDDSPLKGKRGQQQVRRTEGWVFTAPISADFLLAAIDDNNGDMEAAIRDLLAEQGIRGGPIVEYQIKVFDWP